VKPVAEVQPVAADRQQVKPVTEVQPVADRQQVKPVAEVQPVAADRQQVKPVAEVQPAAARHTDAIQTISNHLNIPDPKGVELIPVGPLN
jgi:hypothetical protein